MSTARTALSRDRVEARAAAAGENLRARFERAVALEPDPDGDLELIGVLRADRRIPQRHQPRAQRVDLGLRQAGRRCRWRCRARASNSVPRRSRRCAAGRACRAARRSCRRRISALLLRRLLRRQRLRLAPWPALCSSCFLSFSAIGSGLGCGCGSGGFSAVALISFFSVTLGVGSSTGFGSSLLLDQRLWRVDLGRVLDALGHLGEFLLAHQVDRQRFGRRHLEGLAGKRHQRPQQHRRVQAGRDR